MNFDGVAVRNHCAEKLGLTMAGRLMVAILKGAGKRAMDRHLGRTKRNTYLKEFWRVARLTRSSLSAGFDLRSSVDDLHNSIAFCPDQAVHPSACNAVQFPRDICIRGFPLRVRSPASINLDEAGAST